MPLRWQIVRDAVPDVRKWGDEYVVHHPLSNDTYRLSASAGRILTKLMSAEVIQGERIDSTCAMDDGDTEDTLSALARLGFITQC